MKVLVQFLVGGLSALALGALVVLAIYVLSLGAGLLGHAVWDGITRGWDIL